MRMPLTISFPSILSRSLTRHSSFTLADLPSAAVPLPSSLKSPRPFPPLQPRLTTLAGRTPSACPQNQPRSVAPPSPLELTPSILPPPRPLLPSRIGLFIDQFKLGGIGSNRLIHEPIFTVSDLYIFLKRYPFYFKSVDFT